MSLTPRRSSTRKQFGDRAWRAFDATGAYMGALRRRPAITMQARTTTGGRGARAAASCRGSQGRGRTPAITDRAPPPMARV
ncbi:hypothetical protein GCM10018965_016990 [Nonomuraea roseola]